MRWVGHERSSIQVPVSGYVSPSSTRSLTVSLISSHPCRQIRITSSNYVDSWIAVNVEANIVDLKSRSQMFYKRLLLSTSFVAQTAVVGEWIPHATRIRAA